MTTTTAPASELAATFQRLAERRQRSAMDETSPLADPVTDDDRGTSGLPCRLLEADAERPLQRVLVLDRIPACYVGKRARRALLSHVFLAFRSTGDSAALRESLTPARSPGSRVPGLRKRST
jgi:hypothetical protein